MKALLFSLALFAAGALPVYGGTMTIASQNFDTHSLTSGTSDNTNFTASSGVAFDIGGSGLGWTASITSGPIFGSEGSDLIGVVNSTVASGGTGSSNDLRDATGITGNWYHIDDADGTFSLTFEQVDTTGFVDLMLDFTWASNLSTYESEVTQGGELIHDGIEVFVNGNNLFSVLGESGTSLETLENGPQVNAFTAVSLDLSAFDGQAIDLVFSIANNAGGEDIGFDNVVLSGTMVPEPAAFACFAVGCLGMAFVRRRRNERR